MFSWGNKKNNMYQQFLVEKCLIWNYGIYKCRSLFQGKFLSSYETAQENCHLICIPCTECLQGVNITKKFVGKSTIAFFMTLGYLILSTLNPVF